MFISNERKRYFKVMLAISVFLAVVGIARADWLEKQKLIDPNGAAEDHFGWSVSIDGDYAIVGALNDDDKGSSSGSAYVFYLDGLTWIQQAKLTASDGAAGDRFGYSVSISGDYALVGAFYDDDNGDNSGSAYIFKRNGTDWIEQDKLVASDGTVGDQFGSSVSIDGEYAIVGAAANDDPVHGTDTGSAYIFQRSNAPNDPNWYEQTKLMASDAEARDGFGCSVSIYSDYVIVGAGGGDGQVNGSGSAYIFQRIADPCWIEQAKLVASDGAYYDSFGRSVSINSNYAIVGAHV